MDQLKSDERLVGTDLGVIKRRVVAPLSEDKRFDARALENTKGKPWRPSTKHSGSRIRTHIKEDDEEDGSDEDEEGERPVEVNFQEEEDMDITIDEVTKGSRSHLQQSRP